MDKNFIKFCRYHVIEDEQERQYNELLKLAEDNNFDFEDMFIRSKKYIKTLKKQAQNLNFDLDFESFCSMLETYITNKKNFTDKQKEKYLVVLLNLSEIYDINLRAELESSNNKYDTSEKDLFISLCRHFITNSLPEEYENIKQIAIKEKINFQQLELKVKKFINKIQKACEKLGFDVTENTFVELLNKYIIEKKNMTDKEKTSYLKTLLFLSEIYEVNLREKYLDIQQTEKNIESKIEDLPIENVKDTSIFKEFSNPLDNEILLKAMLYQRYNFGKFEVRELILPNEKKAISKNNNYDFTNKQIELLIRIYSIFIDKLNNYAIDDLNPLFVNLINDEDIKRLNKISKKDLFRLIKSLNSNIADEKLCKKLNVSTNLLEFLKKSLNATTYTNAHIGVGENNLFNTSSEPYISKIYINTPYSKETISFLNTYILECLDNNISYEMNNNWNYNIFKNTTILYATKDDLLKKISILDEIASKHPELISCFGTPLQNCSQINNSYYSVAHSGIIDESNNCLYTYNEYFNDISEIAYYRILAKLTITKITDTKDIDIINNFIALKNIKFNTEIHNPLYAKYNEVEFIKIKDTINKYISEISNTLKIYMEEESKIILLIDEFRKSLLYISNICQRRNKKANSNIAISDIMEKLFIN